LEEPLGYFDDEANVEAYIKMAEGYDGRHLIDVLKEHLPEGSSVLELGIGPGVDLLLLSKYYQVTGSDNSTIFLDRFKKQQPSADLVKLDAASINIDRAFDCIYSSKVLHHLSRQELKASFLQQSTKLNGRGLVMHSFWRGEQEESYDGLRFVYYTEDSIQDSIGPDYEILDVENYTEMDLNDSFYILLRKLEAR
jgi:cyclopropane fatty-acyl-phospholipid synthase-like methyltransferase